MHIIPHPNTSLSHLTCMHGCMCPAGQGDNQAPGSSTVISTTVLISADSDNSSSSSGAVCGGLLERLAALYDALALHAPRALVLPLCVQRGWSAGMRDCASSACTRACKQGVLKGSPISTSVHPHRFPQGHTPWPHHTCGKMLLCSNLDICTTSTAMHLHTSCLSSG